MVNPPRKPTQLNAQVNELSRTFADRAYSGTGASSDSLMRPITINLPTWMIHELEEISLRNKRCRNADRSVSALIRRALIDSGALSAKQDCDL